MGVGMLEVDSNASFLGALLHTSLELKKVIEQEICAP